ncbi:hypothetical protein NBRC116495_17660 [Aurantivibrio plasticivorans]
MQLYKTILSQVVRFNSSLNIEYIKPSGYDKAYKYVGSDYEFIAKSGSYGVKCSTTGETFPISEEVAALGAHDYRNIQVLGSLFFLSGRKFINGSPDVIYFRGDFDKDYPNMVEIPFISLYPKVHNQEYYICTVVRKGEKATSLITFRSDNHEQIAAVSGFIRSYIPTLNEGASGSSRYLVVSYEPDERSAPGNGFRGGRQKHCLLSLPDLKVIRELETDYKASEVEFIGEDSVIFRLHEKGGIIYTLSTDEFTEFWPELHRSYTEFFFAFDKHWAYTGLHTSQYQESFIRRWRLSDGAASGEIKLPDVAMVDRGQSRTIKLFDGQGLTLLGRVSPEHSGICHRWILDLASLDFESDSDDVVLESTIAEIIRETDEEGFARYRLVYPNKVERDTLLRHIAIDLFQQASEKGYWIHAPKDQRDREFDGRIIVDLSKAAVSDSLAVEVSDLVTNLEIELQPDYMSSVDIEKPVSFYIEF